MCVCMYHTKVNIPSSKQNKFKTINFPLNFKLYILLNIKSQ